MVSNPTENDIWFQKQKISFPKKLLWLLERRFLLWLLGCEDRVVVNLAVCVKQRWTKNGRYRKEIIHFFVLVGWWLRKFTNLGFCPIHHVGCSKDSRTKTEAAFPKDVMIYILALNAYQPDNDTIAFIHKSVESFSNLEKLLRRVICRIFVNLRNSTKQPSVL